MPVVEDVRMAELLLVSPTHLTAVTHLPASQFISRQWWSPVQITWRLEVQLNPVHMTSSLKSYPHMLVSSG